MRRGSFALPPSVISATDKFKREADPMRGFIDERVESKHPNNAPFIARTDIYNAYTTWATLNGFMQMSAQRFYESFMAAAVDTMEFPIKIAMRDGHRGFRGIVLR
jgi:phage/plasmid-associated DNA primase